MSIHKPIILLLLLIPSSLKAGFDDYFDRGTLRIDMIRSGNANTSAIAIHRIIAEPNWGGPSDSISGPFDFGKHKYVALDSATNNIIFSGAYAGMFSEWQTTVEADKMNRSFEETVLLPFPRKTIKLIFLQRNRDNSWKEELSLFINPADKNITRNNTPAYPYVKIHDSGLPSQKLDIVFIPEGYTLNEMAKFEKDAEKMKDYLLKARPFSAMKKSINLWRVDVPSAESGTDFPTQDTWKQTLLNSNFNTFNTERYLTLPSHWKMRDVAANVPYDQVVVVVNSTAYGGGGFFNFYTILTAGNLNSDFLLLHEFGHSLAGLADEYYTSDVAMQDFYPEDVEPWEANITTLVDFESKWKGLVAGSTPVPTPSTDNYVKTIGVFEGAGYASKGVYRPQQDCTMKSVKYNNLCPVCQQTIVAFLRFHDRE